MMGDKNGVLLTGATGFLGRELLKLLIERWPLPQPIFCLIRGRSDEKAGRNAKTPANRLTELLSDLGFLDGKSPHVARVFAVSGDLGEHQLGLSSIDLATLQNTVGHIYHGAATVRFDLPLSEARATNVEGTRKILELIEHLSTDRQPVRLNYIGTAFVAGTQTGLQCEGDLLLEQAFHNTYEQTKAEAEQLVRRYMTERGLKATLFRPSIIVGNSQTGATTSFKVMYWPLKVFSRGLIPVVPASRSGFVDLVPVDFVVEAIWELSRREDTVGECYHLAAGPSGIMTIGEALDEAASFFRVRKPLFVDTATYDRFIRPVFRLFFRGKRRQALDAGRVYVPYLDYRALFDTTNTRTALASSALAFPSVRTYFKRLLRFCVESDWGKRSV